jgi:SAM-dependent methyltransferase
MDKPFSPACERNRIPILKVMQEVIPQGAARLLEIGSGTGQHAVYLAPHFPHMLWITSDVKENHRGIKLWLDESGAHNIVGPGEFEVGKDPFPKGEFDVVFTSNTFHIMSWAECSLLIRMLGENLRPGALVLIYGPFNYGGKFTSEGNAELDRNLRQQAPLMGLRDFESVRDAFAGAGLELVKDHEMPANNRMLSFRKTERIQ